MEIKGPPYPEPGPYVPPNKGPLAWQAANLKRAASARAQPKGPKFRKLKEQELVDYDGLEINRRKKRNIQRASARNYDIENKMCHYCGEPATTRDHVVPLSFLLQKYGFRGTAKIKIQNIVPACEDCNNLKSSNRSDCECDICTTAWDELGPTDWRKDLPVVHLVRNDS